MASKRLHPNDDFWIDKKRPFITGVCFVFILLQLLFLGNLSYLYGILFKSSHRVHNLNILSLNLDTNDSPIESSVSAAYQALKSDDFLSLQAHSSTMYPDLRAAREAVCQGHYWGAIVVTEGAYSRLSDALAGGTAADDYSPSDAITLIYNTARYTSATLGDIIGNLQTLVGAANAAYGQVEPSKVQTLNVSSLAAVNAFRNAIGSTTLDIMPTPQGPRVLLNTVSMVFPIIQQFFFLMALNGISTQYKLYSRLSIFHAMSLRGVLSTIYTFISSLAMVGYIWAFRESWGVTAGMFFLTWMVLWLYMFLNFVIIDAATSFIPMSFVPFFLITWVVLNVGSTIYPLQLTAGFYHWQNALPAYNTYNILVNVWSHGCNPQIYRNLPVNFSWAVLGLVLANIGMYRRCELAATVEMEEEVNAQNLSGIRSSDSHPDRAAKEESPPSSTRVSFIGGQRNETASGFKDVQEVSKLGIRMPFADTLENVGLERRKTEPGWISR